jgi:hypothetical protein
MLPISPTAREMLAGPHEAYTRVEVWRGGAQLLSDLPFSTGNVRATLQSRVTRNLDMTLAPEWFPETPTDLLAPFGSELRVWRGVSPGGVTNHPSFVWPVFRGPITKVSVDTDGACSLNGVDLAGEVAGTAFEQPFGIGADTPLHATFRSVVSEAYEAAEFGTFDVSDRGMPALGWDEDRGKALDDMAAGAGAFWYALADGRFVLRAVPWVYSDEVVDLTIDSSLPIFRRASIAYDRSNVFNQVVVRSERTDGSAPSRYVARDTDPASPVVYGGAYGRKTLHSDAQSAYGAGGLQIVGETLLQRSKALAQSWSATIVPYPPLELGDLIQFDVELGRDGRRRRSKQVVSGFTMPLNAQGDMSLELRSLMPRGEAIV